MKTDELFSRPLRSLDEIADLSASQLLVISFIGLIVLGWLGFLFLPGLYEGAPMHWVDALFISASAVCVTGLSPIDVPNVLSFWGELWLVALIQAGALGILTFAAMVAAAAGRRSGLDIEEAAGGFASVLPRGTPRQMLWTIFGVTIAVEATGALLLFGLWLPDHGVLEALWLAVFHAVSAFGNAGFSLFSDNLMGFRDDVVQVLRDMGLEAALPQGSIYVWCAVPHGWNSLDFTLEILGKACVSLTPGTVFGEQGEGYVRLALPAGPERLEEAMQRLAEWRPS